MPKPRPCRACGSMCQARRAGGAGLCRPCVDRGAGREAATRTGWRPVETPPAPKRAVKFRPGSPEKIAAMAARYAAGERLFHGKDARLFHPHDAHYMRDDL